MSIEREKFLNMLDSLADALGSSEGQTIEEIKAELESEGIDVDATLSHLKKTREDISLASRRLALKAAKERREKILEKGHAFIGKFAGWAKEQLIERIIEIGGSQTGLAYRDLKSMGPDELTSILEDLEMTINSSTEEDNNNE